MAVDDAFDDKMKRMQEYIDERQIEDAAKDLLKACVMAEATLSKSHPLDGENYKAWKECRDAISKATQ